MLELGIVDGRPNLRKVFNCYFAMLALTLT